jgi:hypothetical protein
MKPQEKMDWFWATGVLPGTLFDDMDDQKARKPGRWSRIRNRIRRPHAGRAHR